MKFEFNQDQVQLHDSVRSLLADRWSITRLRQSLGQPGPDLEISGALAELGLLQALVPEAQGGLGLSLLDLALVLEEFGRRALPGPLLETILATDVIARHGSGAQKDAWLKPVAEAGAFLSFAQQEPEKGFGPGEVELAATPLPDGCWRLDGRKTLAPYAESASRILVAARRPDGQVALFALRPGQPGLRMRANVTLDPSYRCFDLFLENVQAPRDDMLPPAAAERLQLAGAATAALHLVGCGSQAMEMALDYAKQRKQFGKPIGSFQALKHKFTDMFVALESARSAAYYAAWAVAAESPDQNSAVAIAKATAGDASRLACNDSHQIHGGIGFTWDYDLHFFIKRGKFFEYLFGDAPYHREALIASVLQQNQLEAAQ